MAVFNSLTIGGINSLDYGIYITGEGVYDAPNRAVEMVEIHGRNGALILDKGHYENIEIKYPCGSFGESGKTFEQRITEFKNAVLSLRGYQRLTDTYATDVYRLASCANGFEVAPVQGGKAGEFDLVFNCKPQRFLTSGETLVTVANNGTVTNPTQFDSQPVIEVEGYGTLAFNGYEVTVENATYGKIQLTDFARITPSPITKASSQYTCSFDSGLVNAGDSFEVTNTSTVSYPLASSTTFIIGYDTSAYTCISASKSIDAGLSDIASHAETNVALTAGLKKASFTVGTASTFSGSITGTYTFQAVGSSSTVTASMRLDVQIEYDGDSAITARCTRTIVSNPNGILSLDNTTRWDCRVFFAIADSTASILGHPTYIDCGLGEAYKIENDQFISLNAYIDLGSDLPTLASGTNTFTMSNTITSLKVKPNWWKL